MLLGSLRLRTHGSGHRRHVRVLSIDGRAVRSWNHRQRSRAHEELNMKISVRLFSSPF
jgi:hypothetical protein